MRYSEPGPEVMLGFVLWLLFLVSVAGTIWFCVR
jgi:hypothetical protein